MTLADALREAYSVLDGLCCHRDFPTLDARTIRSTADTRNALLLELLERGAVAGMFAPGEVRM